MKRWWLVTGMVVLLISLGGCRSETQNVIRRNIQDFTGQRMYITLYTIDGTPIFEGIVDGKVTRSGRDGSAEGDATGSYVFWYDEQGRYHQSDLPYLLTSYARTPGTQTTP
jgi:uncharacterized protein YcfL